jgi:hypothetical protein
MARRQDEPLTSPDPVQIPVAWTEELEGVLDDWRRRAWAAQTAHYRRATSLRRRHVWLGVPVVILTTMVGTSLFATLSKEEVDPGLRVAVATVSVGAAVLAAVQTFFAFAQRADRHVLAADWYAAIRRRIEQMLALPREARDDPRKTLDALRKELNTVGSQFPEIGERYWLRAATEFEVREPPDGSPPGV